MKSIFNQRNCFIQGQAAVNLRDALSQGFGLGANGRAEASVALHPVVESYLRIGTPGQDVLDEAAAGVVSLSEILALSLF